MNSAGKFRCWRGKFVSNNSKFFGEGKTISVTPMEETRFIYFISFDFACFLRLTRTISSEIFIKKILQSWPIFFATYTSMNKIFRPPPPMLSKYRTNLLSLVWRYCFDVFHNWKYQSFLLHWDGRVKTSYTSLFGQIILFYWVMV